MDSCVSDQTPRPGDTECFEPLSATVVSRRYVVSVTTSVPVGDLRLGHILAAAGLDPGQVLVLRHTLSSDGLVTTADLEPVPLQAYVRRQTIGNKVKQNPPNLWLNFLADGARRSRFLTAYDNHGEVISERSHPYRYFDLRTSDSLARLRGRLVIEWSADAINWAKSGKVASNFPVVEIADPQAVPFPGYDLVRLTFTQLRSVVNESRYRAWRTALAAVQGIYMIADATNGKLYVGKADGHERILGRWATYAADGHGGNVALQQLLGRDAEHSQHFIFSILRVYGPSVPTAEVDLAESHYKDVLLTRHWGYNKN